MHELVINLHMHTHYSDGYGTHKEIAQAALNAGLDAVIVTDHNVWVNGPSGYYQDNDRQVLLLAGEEIHDQTREPQKNHLLVFGVQREIAALAHDLPRLLETIRQSGGLSFLAHIIDPSSHTFGEPDISWVNWETQDYTGIELWNAMSEFKGLLRNKLLAIFYAYNPRRIGHGPYPAALRKWDELLTKGRPIVAIGGSDAHALVARMGPLKRILFPYEFHFRSINTHLLTPELFSGDITNDRQLILDALRQGHAFIGYDLPASTRGFRFSAQGKDITAWMGDEIPAKYGVTFQIRLPFPTECNLLKDGKIIKTWSRRENCTFITTQPGIYRVEVYTNYLGSRRGWIFSNPIYVR